MVVSSGSAFVAVDYHSGSISRGHIKLRFVAWNRHRVSVLGIFYQNYAMRSDWRNCWSGLSVHALHLNVQSNDRSGYKGIYVLQFG